MSLPSKNARPIEKIAAVAIATASPIRRRRGQTSLNSPNRARASTSAPGKSVCSETARRPSRAPPVISPQTRLSAGAEKKARSGGEKYSTLPRVRRDSGYSSATRRYGLATTTRTMASAVSPAMVASTRRRGGRGRPARHQNTKATTARIASRYRSCSPSETPTNTCHATTSQPATTAAGRSRRYPRSSSIRHSGMPPDESTWRCALCSQRQGE